MGSARAHDPSKLVTVQLLAVVTTGVMLGLQLLGGIATGSLALLAAAGLTLPTLSALALTTWARRIAETKTASRLPYPFARMGSLAHYTVGIASFAIGVWVLSRGVARIVEPIPVSGWPMLGIGVVGMAANASTLLLLRRADDKHRAPQTAAWRVTGDLFGSAVVTAAAAAVLLTGWLWLDTMLAVPVAVLLLLLASVTVAESGKLLLKSPAPNVDREGIVSDLKENVRGVVDVQHFHIWSSDGVHRKATLQAWLSEDADAHAAICGIKARLAKHHRIEHVTVEPEFQHDAVRPAGTSLH